MIIVSHNMTNNSFLCINILIIWLHIVKIIYSYKYMTKFNHIVMTDSNKKIWLYMTKYSHIGMTKNNEYDERSRGNPKRGPKTPWRTRYGKLAMGNENYLIWP